MIAGARLAALAGSTGTAVALLLAIGTGATTGAALAAYSGLASGTASDHLLTDVAPVSPGSGAISGYAPPGHGNAARYRRALRLRRRRRGEEEFFTLGM